MKDIVAASFLLDEKTTWQLLNSCYKAYHTEINDILLAALGLAVKKIFQSGSMMVRLEGHGREDIGASVDVTRTVGWFTSVYPVLFDLGNTHDPVRQVIEVKETLRRVPNKGMGYGVLRYLSGKAFGLEPEISFNYLGDFGSGVGAAARQRLFLFSNEQHGAEMPDEAPRDVLLDVAGMVVEGRLRMSVSYSGKQFRDVTIGRLLSGYEQELENLVRRLSGETRVFLTPADLTYKGLTLQQLEKLNETI